MLQLNDSMEPESPGAAILHPAETEEGVEVAFTPPEADRSLGHGASVACCPPLQTLTPFIVHNPTVQAKVKDYFVFRVSCSIGPLIFRDVHVRNLRLLEVLDQSSVNLWTSQEWEGGGGSVLSVMMLLCDADLSQVPSSRLWATSGPWLCPQRMERCSVCGCWQSKCPGSMWLMKHQASVWRAAGSAAGFILKHIYTLSHLSRTFSKATNWFITVFLLILSLLFYIYNC